MNEQDKLLDRVFTQGRKSLAINIAHTCMKELGDTGRENASLIIERQEAISMLRQVCEEHGDNNWPDDLYLSDIIEKHLWRNLNSG